MRRAMGRAIVLVGLASLVVVSGGAPGAGAVASRGAVAHLLHAPGAPAVPPQPLTPPPPPPPPIIPLTLGNARFSLFTVNPRFTAQEVAFTLSVPARVMLSIRRAGTETIVRTVALGQRDPGTIDWSWNGRDDAGHAVPEDNYSYHIWAVDDAGERVSAVYNGLGVTYKRIVVSLSQQRLTAYDGDAQFLTTLVTTGNAALPTPLGVFPILGRYHPFTFKSPWPIGSPYYYPPSPVQYALLFDDRGYFVHDAPWRTVFGPGTNAALGKPGLNYTGTHGCVNVPPWAEQQLFLWSTIGTIVQVVA